MAQAAIGARQAAESAEVIAGIARVLHDSAERHRQVLAVLRAITGTTTLPDAKRLARSYLRSVA